MTQFIKDSTNLIGSLSSMLNKNIGSNSTLTPALISATVSFFVLILTLCFAWYSKKRDKQLEVYSYRNIILNWIELTSSTIKGQIQACKEFATKIEDSEIIHPEGLNHVHMLAEKVDAIGIDRFINTFIINTTHPSKNDNNKMAFNLISQFTSVY